VLRHRCPVSAGALRPMTEFAKILRQAELEGALQTDPRRDQDNRDAQNAVPPAASLESTDFPAPRSTPRGSVPQPTEEASKSPDGVEGHLVSLLDPTSVTAEPYRMVRQLLEQLHSTRGLSIVAVSSAMVGEGKTTASINVAGALSQASDARVLLVDADLRNPSITRHLAMGEGDHRGLSDAIVDPNLGLDDVVSPRPPFNLDVLPAGAVGAAPYEVLKSPRLGDLLNQARSRYDFVIL